METLINFLQFGMKNHPEYMAIIVIMIVALIIFFLYLSKNERNPKVKPTTEETNQYTAQINDALRVEKTIPQPDVHPFDRDYSDTSNNASSIRKKPDATERWESDIEFDFPDPSELSHEDMKAVLAAGKETPSDSELELEHKELYGANNINETHQPNGIVDISHLTLEEPYIHKMKPPEDSVTLDELRAAMDATRNNTSDLNGPLKLAVSIAKELAKASGAETLPSSQSKLVISNESPVKTDKREKPRLSLVPKQGIIKTPPEKDENDDKT